MVRGSGSHNRQNSSSNRGSRNTARTSTRNASTTTTRGSGRRTTAAAVAPEPPSPRRSSGNRESSSRESSSSIQRANRGSGTRNTSNSNSASRTTMRSTTSTATGGDTQRNNQGSGSVGTASFSAVRESNRANHGSGTRTSNESTRPSRSSTSTTTTRDSQRSNHESRSGASSARETQRANRGSGIRSSTSTIRTENLSANRGSGTRNTRTTTRESPHQQQRMDYDVVNPQDAPLYRCCLCLCEMFTGIFIAVFGVVGTILCCKLCRKAPTNDSSATTTMNQPNRRRSGLRNRLDEIEEQMWFSPLWSVFGGMIFSLLVFLILVQNSTTTNFVSGNSSYDGNIRTMFAGETLRVYVPMLTRNVSVEVVHDPPTSRGMRAALYKSYKVPSLTGPKLELQHDSELDLNGDSFVYDYYNLNPGSSVSVRMNQINNDGGTYFYLLEGSKALQELQDGTNVDPNHWERIAVATAGPHGGNIFYKLTNTYKPDSIYTLVYDNQSTHRVSSVDVETDIVMTTHDLNGYSPACNYMRTGDACHVYAGSDCVILDAFAVQEENEEDYLSEEGEGDKTISLRIETYRDWKSIAIYSTIPLAISVLYLWGCIFYCCCKRNQANIDGIATEPLLSPNELEEGGSEAAAADRPPPTAPHFVETSPPVEATAPFEPEPQQPDNVVVIPPESVQVVTK